MFDAAADRLSFEQAVALAAAAGRRCHPRVVIAADDFARHAAQVGADVAGLGEHGADLYLACACALGDRQALAVFEKQLLPAVDGKLRGMGVGEEQLDEIRQGLRVRLLSDGQPRIASYAARGPLVAWLRIAATRLALNIVDGARLESARMAADGVALDRLITAAADPELEVVRGRFQAQFQRALDDSLAALYPRAKEVLRLHYLDGQNLEAIAAAYGVHRATVARWLVAIRSTVLANLRDRLRTTLHPTSSDFRSLAAALEDQLTISVDRLLPGPAR
jgi:RNA polymerase sigma-70 factor, ECF subfamily